MDVDVEQDGSGSVGETREIKAFWVLYIDIMIISLAGNPFDAAWTAVLAALRDTKLPRAWWHADNETVICSDLVSEARRLSLRGLPVASSFGVFEADAASGWRAVIVPDAEEERKIAESDRKGIQRRWVLADPDGYEEGLAQERVCLVIDKDQRQNGKVVIVKMEKNGGFAVDRKELKELVAVSAQRWEEINKILGQC
jgi:exosome complex component RRP43